MKKFLSNFKIMYMIFLLLPLVISTIAIGYDKISIAGYKTLAAAQATTPIQHVVVLMMENRTYDSMFGTFPGGNGITETHANNPLPSDYDHHGPALSAAMDGGKMDEFPTRSKVQYTQSDIPNYWNYAQTFGLSDNFFQSYATSSSPNHMAMVAGQNGGVFETSPQNGCDSIQNNLILSADPQTGTPYWSYPCYNISSAMSLLDTNGLTWKYYSGQSIWDDPLMLQPYANSTNDINDSGNAEQFATDVQNGNLANVTWVTPPVASSDHPPYYDEAGQNFVTDSVNAIMNSPYWNNTAIFVTWDDWGGYYDHVVPPKVDNLPEGLRAPLLVISPYAKASYISHQFGEFTSFVKFIESNWALPNLGQRDANASISNLMDFFNFSQTPQTTDIMKDIPYSSLLQPPTGGPALAGTAAISSLVPTDGDVNDTYTYSIIYKGTGTPAIHNVMIDGTAYAMTAVGTIKGGGVTYQYQTKLALGNHTYSFIFSNPSGATVTIPDNNTLYQGPFIHPFDVTKIGPLSDQAVAGSTITFSATYTSPANKAPVLAVVDIDGVAHTLKPTLPKRGLPNYTTGIIYKYAQAMSLGEHYFRFRFDDGSGQVTYEGKNYPNMNTLMLSKPSISATTGTTSTSFTYKITYTQQTGIAPVKSLIYIDGTPHVMSLVSGSYQTGALYQYVTTLPAGSHNYSFVFGDGLSVWSNPNGVNYSSGPTVAALGQTITPTPTPSPTPTAINGGNVSEYDPS